MAGSKLFFSFPSPRKFCSHNFVRYLVLFGELLTTMYKKIAHWMTRKFEKRYNYDGTYMHELLEDSLGGFKAFQKFMPMSQYREKCPGDVYFTAKLMAMQEADCGSCLALNVKMAVEAGMSRKLVSGILNDQGELPEALEDVRNFARAVASAGSIDPDLLERIRRRYGRTAVAELALAIASARIFPTLKRSFGYAQSCALTPVEI